jgi:uncharacterized protein YqjF (DUF2071 family)
VKTVFRRCFLANFAVDPEVLVRELPPHLDLEVHRGRAYLSVVIAEMDKLRPAGIPRFLGFTYDQIVYRVVVSFRGERGVHFLRSDADSPLMCFVGNLISIFRFHRADIAFSTESDRAKLDVTTRHSEADIEATYDLARAGQTMPSTSSFGDLAAAQAWLVELFAAFDFDERRQAMNIVRIHRGEWNIGVIPDARGRYEFMERAPFAGHATLDSIFYAAALPYHWHRLQRVRI